MLIRFKKAGAFALYLILFIHASADASYLRLSFDDDEDHSRTPSEWMQVEAQQEKYKTLLRLFPWLRLEEILVLEPHADLSDLKLGRGMGDKVFVANTLERFFRRHYKASLVGTVARQVIEGKKSLSTILSEYAFVCLTNRSTFDRTITPLKKTSAQELLASPMTAHVLRAFGRTAFYSGYVKPFGDVLGEYVLDFSKSKEGPVSSGEYLCDNVHVGEKDGLYEIVLNITRRDVSIHSRKKYLRFSGEITQDSLHDFELSSDTHKLHLHRPRHPIDSQLDKRRIKELLGMSLKQPDSWPDWQGFLLLHGYTPIIPLMLVKDIATVRPIMLASEESDMTAAQAHERLLGVAQALQVLYNTLGFDTPEWKSAMASIRFYDEYQESPSLDLSPLFLRTLLPPCAAIFQVISASEEHALAYGQRVKKKLTKALVTDESCPDPFKHYLNRIIAHYVKQAKKPKRLQFISGHLVSRFFYRPRPNGGLRLFHKDEWEIIFNFDPALLVALYTLTPESGRVAQDAVGLSDCDETLAKYLFVIYTRIVPLPIPNIVCPSLADNYVKAVIARKLSNYPGSTINLQAAFYQDKMESIEEELRGYPCLPKMESRERSQGLLFLGELNLNVIFNSEFRLLCRDLMFPELYPLPCDHTWRIPSDCSQLYQDKIVELLKDNPGKTLAEVIEPFHQELREKYERMLQTGWLDSKAAEVFVFETEIRGASPDITLANQISGIIDLIFDVIRKNFPSLYGGQRVEVGDRFLKDLGYNLLQNGKGHTVEKAMGEVFKPWLRRTLDDQKILLIPRMLDEITDMVDAGTHDVRTAIEATLPEIYERLLGAGITTPKPLRWWAAQGLMKGESFLKCHGLLIDVPKHNWVRTIVSLHQISHEAYDLKEDDACRCSLFKYEKKASVDLGLRFAEEQLVKMQPFELVCWVRTANKLITKSSWTKAQERAQRRKELMAEALEMFERYRQAKIDLNFSNRLNGQWKRDGRSLAFYDMAVQTAGSSSIYLEKTGFLINIEQLLTDPYLKKSPINELIPEDISDERYEQMQDILCCIARHQTFEGPEARFEGPHAKKEHADLTCSLIRKFFRLAIQNDGEFHTHKPVVAHQTYRKRIALVYERTLEPFIATEQWDQVYTGIGFMCTYAMDCIDGARRGLSVMEQHPAVMGMVDTPDIFERLAYIIRDFKLQVINQIAKERAQKRFNDPIAYDLFLRNAFNLPLWLGLEDCDQFYLADMAYTDKKVRKDMLNFIEKYRTGLIPAIIKAIRYRAQPDYDLDPSVLYMDKIADWASESIHYCNSFELDKDLMDGPVIKKQVVQNLLEDAGYVTLIN